MRRNLVLWAIIASAIGCTASSTPTAATPPVANPSSEPALPCVYELGGGNYGISSSESLVRPPLNGGSFDIPLVRKSGQCSWQAVSSDSWITAAPASGSDGGTVQVKVEELVRAPSTAPSVSDIRQGTVLISWPGGPAPLKISVLQNTCGYDPSANVSISSAGGLVRTYGTHSSACPFSPSSDAEWLGAVRNAITYVTVSALPNSSGMSRTGTVTIAYSGGASHLVVTQAP